MSTASFYSQDAPRAINPKLITPPSSLAGNTTPPCSPTDDALSVDGSPSGLLRLLFTAVPNTKSVTFDGHFLIIHTADPPARSLPKTIHGLTTYITSNPDDSGPIAHLTRNPSKGTLTLASDIDARNQEDVFEHHITKLTTFLHEQSITATEIQYWKFFAVIVLKDKIQDLAAVPCSFAQLPCYYLFERDMQIPVINSVPNTEHGVCGVADGYPSARTWIRVDGAREEKWVKARWIWKGWGRGRAVDMVPMAGWHLCVSRKGLSEMLGGEG